MHKINSKLKIQPRRAKFWILSCGFAFLVLTFAFSAFAATLYFSPSSGDYSLGNIINASVLVNTQGQAINNSDAIVNFPASLLEIMSLSKSGSIFSLWPEEPAFSNSAGTISFNGGLPTPGFNGTAGRILNLTFRVKNAGTASLLFSSGAVRANDGYGTDILQTKGQAQYNLIAEQRPVAPAPTLGTPQAPSISSPTHPDSNKWYARSVATFNWNVPSGVNSARLLIGRNSAGQPIVLYSPAIAERTVEDLEDGVWYFSAQLRNDVGWGEVARFRVQIDTESPERFSVEVLENEDPTNPIIRLRFSASDRTSGIDRYEVVIDDNETVFVSGGPSVLFETSALGSGTHRIDAKAIDRAENSLQESVNVEITPIDSPRITEYQDILDEGELLVVKGETYPDSEVTIYLQREGREPNLYSVKSDSKGGFRFVGETGTQRGNYKLWATVKDKRGAVSLPSETLLVTARPSAIFEFGATAIVTLVILVVLLSLLGLLIYIYIYMKHQIAKFKARLRKDVHKIEVDVHHSFDLLKEDVREQIKVLEKAKTKRKLTQEEEKIIERLKKHFDEAEEFIEKEIKDIEDEIK